MVNQPSFSPHIAKSAFVNKLVPRCSWLPSAYVCISIYTVPPLSFLSSASNVLPSSIAVIRSASLSLSNTLSVWVRLSVCLCLSVFLCVCLPVCVYFCLFVCRFPPPLSISVSLWSGLIPQWHQRRALSTHCVVSHWSTMIDAVLCCSNRSSAHRQTKEKNLNSTKEPFNNNRWRRCLSVCLSMYLFCLHLFCLCLFLSVYICLCV